MGAVAGGGRAARALRLLLLLVMALAAVEYLFGSILDASPLRTYLYTPLNNATQPTFRIGGKTSASAAKRLSESLESTNRNTSNETHPFLHKHETYNTTQLHKSKNNETDSTHFNSTIGQKVNATDISKQEKLNVTVKENEIIESGTLRLITKLKDSIKALSSSEPTTLRSDDALPYCELPSTLGPVPVNKTQIKLSWVDTLYPEVEQGGFYKPANCTARHRVAIIVPFRDRESHLAIFLHHMHPFLMKQQLEYGIFIVEQAGKIQFNRAKLFNVGFVESQKLKPGVWQCFIFHDVDLLPMDERNVYSCPRQPRHMSASIDKHNFRLLYRDLFGGVSAMTLKQFTRVNGFSNKYFGWGGEDDDMSYRLKKMGYHIARYKMSIARYTMLDHKSAAPNPKRYKLLSQTSKFFQKDGLSTLDYVVIDTIKHHLYTLILVNIDDTS